MLPPVGNSIYFHQTNAQQERTIKTKIKNAFSVMAKHFVESYTNKYVLRWSLWWILATAGFLQVQSYIQALWSELGNYDPGLNGIVITAVAIFGLLSALFAGILKLDWRLIGNLVIVLWGIIVGGLVLGGSVTENLTGSYICYVIFSTLYQFMITVASSEIAKQISRDSHGLVFGFNTLLALIIQTFLTLIFVSGHLGPKLTVVMQYWVYGLYYIGISAIYIIIGLSSWFVSKKDIKKTYT